mmetsp:Transcript_1905/g.7646  ORF Transcript_1905/g.7646 Transcript_1905/m.7646 type:complete len:202 (-) Transcript_1905:796-1401(-)
MALEKPRSKTRALAASSAAATAALRGPENQLDFEYALLAALASLAESGGASEPVRMASGGLSSALTIASSSAMPPSHSTRSSEHRVAGSSRWRASASRRTSSRTEHRLAVVERCSTRRPSSASEAVATRSPSTDVARRAGPRNGALLGRDADTLRAARGLCFGLATLPSPRIASLAVAIASLAIESRRRSTRSGRPRSGLT